MSLFIDPYNPNLKMMIKTLHPTPGYCFIVDIVGSTQMKDGKVGEWVESFRRTFAAIRKESSLEFSVMKSLGDALLLFLPSTTTGLIKPLDLVVRLTEIIRAGGSVKVRVGAAFCMDSFDITFIPDTPDVYGKDIDLTARLVELADEGEIVMNNSFAQSALRALARTSSEEFAWIKNQMVGPVAKRLKGFHQAVKVYRLRIPAGGKDIHSMINDSYRFKTERRVAIVEPA